MEYETGEDIVRKMLLGMFQYRANGLEVMIFNDCLEAPMEAAQALRDVLSSPRLSRSEPNCITIAMSGGLVAQGRGVEFNATLEDWESF